ncbi:MAG: hypothetical protein R2712_13680 [Vicinamibacterales bacterium]
MPLARIVVCAAIVAVSGVTTGRAQAPVPTLPYDHVHLNVPDPEAAASWA